MTQFAIIVFPRTETHEAIEAVRARFDPLASLIAAHVTLVFPFADVISADDLRSHVVAAASETFSFRATIASPPRVDGEYLFLDVDAGADTFIELHNRLYGGVLASHRSRTQLYQPHITIARSANPARLREAATEATAALPRLISMVVDHIAVFRFDGALRGTVQDRVDLVPAQIACDRVRATGA